ncbi:CREB/ATF bZIP transcription factor [Sphaerodactylus townsendi]|uniref:CREB/ATF bZIP transcription factor n=1 Tax=Sphaerodactylus townsendi TaxID=933632 RepID=UPI0020264FEA|nr:CREB/ATF bZIP transcription factor [Sphaerodactylus townsendi]
MRHNLTQLLAASSGPSSPREPAAAFPFLPSGDEAEPAANGGGGDDELLFPGFELEDWLEAAVGAGEARPAWARDDSRCSPEAVAVAAGRAARLKAAEAARLNRQKKKRYVEGLESRLRGLAAENRELRGRNRGLCRRLRDVEREASYLRAVLANQSALGRLLGRLAGHGSLRISTGLWQGDDGDEHRGPGDHDYALPAPRDDGDEDEPGPAGLCLHVDRDRVSVEFCSVCSRRASAASPASPASKIFFFRCLPCQAPLCRG